MNQDGKELGARIRRIRTRAGLNLNDVAAKADCSESMLSKIENGKGNPSLNLLHRLAQALSVSIAHLFADDGENTLVLRQGQRPILSTMAPSQGVALEGLMGRQGESLLQAHIHIVAPGGGYGSPISHEGEEVGYVLEGELDLEVDGEIVHLQPGDSFFFRSDRPHRYTNRGTVLTKVIWINTPPTF